MNNIYKMIVAFLCLTVLFGVITAKPAYAAELDLKFDTHDIGTANSWFQPVIIRNVPNRNYAWTCIGDVYYNDGKKPSLYWDSGALLWYMPTHLCAIYKKPYISGSKIRLIWAYIDPTAKSLKMEKLNASDMHEQTYQFGDIPKN
jgi:hypothetical protein